MLGLRLISACSCVAAVVAGIGVLPIRSEATPRVVVGAPTRPATINTTRDVQRPMIHTTDNVAVAIAFKENHASLDYRYSVIPGASARIAVTAEAYNAEGQVISGALASAVPLSFIGSAVSVSPTTMTVGTERLSITGTPASTANAAAWGVTEVRGGSFPVPYDVLTTGFGACTAAVPQMGADTRGCLTVAPLIVSTAGALGPNLAQPLSVAGQIGSAPMVLAQGQDISLSVFEARTGSADEPEVADTALTFLPTMYDKGACTPSLGSASAAGAWPKWIVHGYFFASPTIWYWNYGDPNCVDASGQNIFPPSGESYVLSVGPDAARLPYGFDIHGDSTQGTRERSDNLDLSDGRVKLPFKITVTM